jgi:hypothetical protein
MANFVGHDLVALLAVGFLRLMLSKINDHQLWMI